MACAPVAETTVPPLISIDIGIPLLAVVTASCVDPDDARQASVSGP